MFGKNGITEALDTAAGGGRGHHVGLPCFIDMNYGAGIKQTENARTSQARYNKGVNNHSGETTGVAIPVDINCININDNNGKERPQHERIYDTNGVMTALNSQLGGRHNVAIPVLTPDRAEKRQNGRRFKDNGEPMFTLTAQDRHGVAICPLGILRNVRTDYGKQIRKAYESGDLKISRHKFLAYEIKKDGCSNTLSSVEKDNYLALGIIDPQGRNNKEVSLKDVCPTLRSEAHGNVPNVCVNVNETHNYGDGIFVEMPEGFIVYAIWYEKERCYTTIRKLTPKECFRLQGWTDDYFERAAFVNSDSQLYKQAGNGVTVNVIQAIADKMEGDTN